jgi:DNA-binding NarL/FixJ family response regulator
VIVIADAPVYREGLRAILTRQRGMIFAGEASLAAEAYAMAEVAKPDVAIVDAILPGVDGFAVTLELRRRLPACRVLILGTQDLHRIAERAGAVGASGYLLRTCPAGEIILAILAIGRNERYAPAPASTTDPVLASLSTRETEIFHLAVDGLSNDNISGHLHISVKTVETHRAHINRKLSVHSTAELVRLAARHGLLVCHG